MKMVICDHAKECTLESCPMRVPHEENKYCRESTCTETEKLVKCIFYIDPVLKRVQERFNEWTDEGIETRGDLNIAECLIDAKVTLDRII